MTMPNGNGLLSCYCACCLGRVIYRERAPWKYPAGAADDVMHRRLWQLLPLPMPDRSIA